MVDLGSGSKREMPDYQLSRFACYLTAQNGDPHKPEIAAAQKYFAKSQRDRQGGHSAQYHSRSWPDHRRDFEFV